MTIENYFMCRPQRHRISGQFSVRFYSRDPWPWYQASVIVNKARDAYPHFKDFIESCEVHRSQVND